MTDQQDSAQPEPVAWIVYALYYGEATPQYPPYATKEQAEARARTFVAAAKVEVRPLYATPTTTQPAAAPLADERFNRALAAVRKALDTSGVRLGVMHYVTQTARNEWLKASPAEPAAPAAQSTDTASLAAIVRKFISADDLDASTLGEFVRDAQVALAAHQPSQSDEARCRDTYETTSGNTIVCKTCGACWPLGAATACENARNQLARAALASQKGA